jgi:AraC-like DNA-binding protein
MVGFMAYLMLPLIESYMGITPHALFWYASAICPSLLLLFVWYVFEEQECSLPPPIIALVVFSMGVSLYYAIINIGLPGSPMWVQFLKLGIVVLVLHIVHRGGQVDLLEQRSVARRWFVASMGGVMLVVMSIETFSHYDTTPALDLLQKSIVFLTTFGFSVFFLRKNPNVTLILPPEEIVEQPKDPVLLELLEKMKSERLYADHDLRVGGLADRFGIPEYQLRKKINQELGYRNFNQFVNKYRIEEAGELLIRDSRTPVLSIALEVGFRSISSFNTAFQAAFGMSPTAYRTAGGNAIAEEAV